MTEVLGGVLVPLVTPFTANEAIDFDALGRAVDYCITAGVNGIVAGGSTGEFAALSSDERRKLVDGVVEAAAGRVPVIAQTGATTTAEAIVLSKAAEASGADVLMLITPYYDQPSQAELVQYVTEVASAVELPIMLYNIPGYTGTNLSPELIAGLARKLDNVRYVKDSSGDWAQGQRLIHELGDRIGTFIGWDSFCLSALIEGAAGVLVGSANIVPDELVALNRRIKSGDLRGAREDWERLYPLLGTLLELPYNAAIKYGLGLQGVPVGSSRRPTADLDIESAARLEAALAVFKNGVYA